MQKHTDTVTNVAGAAVSGASVLVKTYPADATATIYSDNGVTQTNNPLTTDASGRFSFYAADGRYSLTISKTGVITQLTLTDSVHLWDPADATAEQLATNVSFTQSGTGAVSRTAQAKMRDVYSVKDFGAVGDGTTDDRAAIQAAMDAMTAGQALYFPTTTGSTYYKVTTSALTIQKVNNLVFYGAGRRASKIAQATAGVDLFDTNNAWATATNGMVFRDLWLEATADARYGINLKATHRSLIQNCRISNFGATNGAGLRTDDSLIVTVDGCDFDSNYDGISDGTGSNTAPNGWQITNCIFETSDRYAINFTVLTGSTISGNVIEGNLKGGIRLNGNCNGIAITGNYFEGNRDNTAGTFDVYLGVGTACEGIIVKGNLFSGHASDTNYYPIRAKYLESSEIGANKVTFGSRFIHFASSGLIRSCTFGPLDIGTRDASQGTGATYGNIPVTFLYYHNKITDYETIFADGQNFVMYDFPYGDWVTNISGVATYARSPNTGATPDEHNGRPVLLFSLTSGATTTYAYTAHTVSATVNAKVRGGWVMWLIDVYVNNASSNNFTLLMNDAGAQSYSQQYGASSSDGWNTYAVCGYFNTSTTLLQAFFYCDNNVEYRFANPRLCVGLNRDMARGLGGPPRWKNSAAPTVGTWADGDVVDNSAPAVGAPQMWVCTTPGTGGGALVFTATANL